MIMDIWFMAAMFVLGLLVSSFLPYKKKQFKKEEEVNIEKELLLKQQAECKHMDLRQVNGLGFAYGIGMVCNLCGKEIKDESRKLQETFFEARVGLGGYKTLAEFEEANKKEQEVRRKWEITHN